MQLYSDLCVVLCSVTVISVLLCAVGQLFLCSFVQWDSDLCVVRLKVLCC